MFGRTTLSKRVAQLESQVASIRRLYETSIAYSDSDPRSALMNARLAAEAICARVLEEQTGESPKGQTLQTLVQRLTHKKAAPEQVLIALSTIQRYGNFGSHHQAGEPQTITPEFAQPCLQALGQVVQWYFSEHGDPDRPTHALPPSHRRPPTTTGIWVFGGLLLAATGGAAALYFLGSQPPKAVSTTPEESAPSARLLVPSRETVAVLPFECLSDDDPASVALERRVTSIVRSRLMNSGRFEMVERDKLDQALAELALSQSEKFDQSQVARIGKLLGAHRLVLGDYFHLGDSLRVNVRFVETETGKILWAAGHDGQASDVATTAEAAATAVLERIPEEN